ncbi:hypothetical protein Acr_22g0002000 [Actinidia rufa]|uniref:Uncharacterized protein n=1 Tax=Actinidia rufa TaxID=165716 RepID=A0A7J0GJ82_9ERIC|nr:hypothetical protein Acr_22g0002000 [Actinidia rufa]
MERAVVSSVVGRLGDMLIQEGKFLAGVSDKVEQLRLELKRMQCFLEDTDHAIHDDDDADERVMNRAAEIQELAYEEAEAILETYVNKVASKGKGGIQRVLNWRSVHKVERQIKTIKDKITDQTRSLKTSSTGGPDQVTSLARERKLEVRRSYHHVIDEDFVGFEQDLKTVVNHLNSYSDDSESDKSDSGNSLSDNAVSVDYISDCRIVSIWGMGGLGKTTLARRILGLTQIWRQMVKRCGGLPLPIVVLGGLLATKSTSREWDVVYKNVKSHRWIEDDVVSKVLALSDRDLPYQLKPCFLYFSYFPEDYEIRAEKLYYLWMAEGILSTEDRGEEETMMEVAECYLGELARRCMVQVQVKGATGRIQYCRIHDILRDLCISKAKICNFLRTIYLQRETDQVDLFSTSTTQIRRLAIHLSRDVENVVLPLLKSTQQLRSILFFTQNPTIDEEARGGPSLQLNSHFKNLKFLRTLDLEGFDVPNISLKAIGELLSLRYLSFRNCTSITNLLQSIFKLRYLETLDLWTSFESDEVIVMKKMERLRHLYLAYNADFRLDIDGRIPALPEYQCFSPGLARLWLNNCELKEDPMPTLERLPNLQRLFVADCSIDKMVFSAKGFPQLKRLAIARQSYLKELTVEKGAMPNLSSLNFVRCRELEMIPEGDEIGGANVSMPWAVS